jgi:predicted phage terminase large subunit-like protein
MEHANESENAAHGQRPLKARGKLKARSTADAAIALARSDLACFSAIEYPRFELAPHNRRIIDALEAVERGEIDRLILTLPPRHGKSLIASQLFPAWYLGRHPDRSIIAASYASELATDFGRLVRNHVTGRIYSRIFPSAKLSGDSAAAHRFSLLAGGNYFAVGAGGPITGRGCDLLLIDDPIKGRVDADSASFRRGLQSWFQSVAYPRLMPGAAIVLIQTRWHEDDLAGFCLREQAQEGWTVLNLPAIAEVDEGSRAEGAALWPEKFPLKRLMQIRQTIGSREWAALYQGRPAPIEGAIFRKEWWKSYSQATLPAEFERIIVSLDCAFKTGTSNDYTAAVVIGVGKHGYYVLHVVKDRVEFPALQRRLEAMCLKFHPDAVLIEDAASGQSLIQTLKAETRLPVLPVKPQGDKESRAWAVTPFVESGRVLLPESAAWLPDFLDELSSFPNAAHDDCVDAFTQAIGYLKKSAESDGTYRFYQDSFIRAAAAHVTGQGGNLGQVAVEMNIPIERVREIVAEDQEEVNEYSREYEETYTRNMALMHGTDLCAKCGEKLGSTKTNGSDGRWYHPTPACAPRFG